LANIFIVEDEPTIQHLYKEFLTAMGFNIIGMASNGKKAVELFKSFKNKPKIIIMDYRLPIKNGLEVSKEILNLEESTKIIFATADNSISKEALSIGVFSVKVKPFSLRCLLNVIEEALKE